MPLPRGRAAALLPPAVHRLPALLRRRLRRGGQVEQRVHRGVYFAADNIAERGEEIRRSGHRRVVPDSETPFHCVFPAAGWIARNGPEVLGRAYAAGSKKKKKCRRKVTRCARVWMINGGHDAPDG